MPEKKKAKAKKMAPLRIKLGIMGNKRKKSSSVRCYFHVCVCLLETSARCYSDPVATPFPQSEDVDEEDSEQEDSSVHSSSVRSDSSGRVKKNKRGRPAKKKKKSRLPHSYFSSLLPTLPLICL